MKTYCVEAVAVWVCLLVINDMIMAHWNNGTLEATSCQAQALRQPAGAA
jgi:hypothetical protein